jgi:hypothetical protein
MTDIDWDSIKKELTVFAQTKSRGDELFIKIPNCAKNARKLTSMMWTLQYRYNYSFYICTNWYKGNPEKNKSGYVALFLKERDLDSEAA